MDALEYSKMPPSERAKVSQAERLKLLSDDTPIKHDPTHKRVTLDPSEIDEHRTISDQW